MSKIIFNLGVKMLSKLTSYFLMITCLAAVSACTPAKFRYRIDPEITQAQSLAAKAQTIAVQVTDLRSNNYPTQNNKITLISGPVDEAAQLKAQIIDNLTRSQFRIISNPLLADLNVELQIETLQAAVNQSMLKSTIKVDSHIRLIASKQGNKIEKLFRTTREQDVANPVKELDVTGVVNQLLSQQLTSIFNEPALLNLAATASEYD
ncbi:YajG family lipoprotein [Aliikangiella maris]|uniref:YajG family lipoprotein n=2 Tax=Aliikangiella maris TaxID=3162458 RepID=A0ABV2BT79_9GAMM